MGKLPVAIVVVAVNILISAATAMMVSTYVLTNNESIKLDQELSQKLVAAQMESLEAKFETRLANQKAEFEQALIELSLIHI